MARFDRAIEFVLSHEGELVHHSNDPGGLTKWGISKRQFPDVDIARLTRDDAIALYRVHYWEGRAYSALDSQEVATKLFDLVVNLGPYTAVRLLQRALNYLGTTPPLKIDGILGPKTVEAVNRCDGDLLSLTLRAYQAHHYIALVESRHESFGPFACGWIRRAMA